MRLSFVRVTTWDEALVLRQVRNQCREGMTHNREIITEEEQSAFFSEQLVPGHTFECYLLVDGDTAAGYGLLKRDGNKKWMTAGLARAYRGRHLSRLLISFITEIAYADPGVEVWIDVSEDNFALIADVAVGYRLVSRQVQDDGRALFIMRHQRDREIDRVERSLVANLKGIEVARAMIAADEVHREAYA